MGSAMTGWNTPWSASRLSCAATKDLGRQRRAEAELIARDRLLRWAVEQPRAGTAGRTRCQHPRCAWKTSLAQTALRTATSEARLHRPGCPAGVHPPGHRGRDGLRRPGLSPGDQRAWCVGGDGGPVRAGTIRGLSRSKITRAHSARTGQRVRAATGLACRRRDAAASSALATVPCGVEITAQPRAFAAQLLQGVVHPRLSGRWQGGSASQLSVDRAARPSVGPKSGGWAPTDGLAERTEPATTGTAQSACTWRLAVDFGLPEVRRHGTISPLSAAPVNQVRR
jgi:hypothetical protein